MTDPDPKYREMLSSLRRPMAKPSTPPRQGLPTFDQMKEAAETNPDGIAVSGADLQHRVQAGLRPQTLAGLKALQEAQPPKEVPPPPAEEEEKSSPDGLGVVENLLASQSSVARLYPRERREQMEKLLRPLDLGDLLINQYVVQEVPIAGKVRVTFRSLNGMDSEFVERRIWEKHDVRSLSAGHYVLLQALHMLVLSLSAVSDAQGIGTKLLDHRKVDGEVDSDLFEKKWATVLRYPTFFLEALDINRRWFEERCAKLLSMDTVGNG